MPCQDSGPIPRGGIGACCACLRPHFQAVQDICSICTPDQALLHDLCAQCQLYPRRNVQLPAACTDWCLFCRCNLVCKVSKHRLDTVDYTMCLLESAVFSLCRLHLQTRLQIQYKDWGYATVNALYHHCLTILLQIGLHHMFGCFCLLVQAGSFHAEQGIPSFFCCLLFKVSHLKSGIRQKTVDECTS